MQYRALLRLLVAGGVGVGSYVGKDSEMMVWLDGVATLKDVGEAVVWVLGRGRLEQWEGRAGGKMWMWRFVGFLGVLVVAYVGRQSDLMDWLAHIASVKDFAEAVCWTIGRERLELFISMVSREARYRCACSRYFADGLLKEVSLLRRAMQITEASAVSDSPEPRGLIYVVANRLFGG